MYYKLLVYLCYTLAWIVLIPYLIVFSVYRLIMLPFKLASNYIDAHDWIISHSD